MKDILYLIAFIIIVCGLGGFLLRERFNHHPMVNLNKPNLWIWSPTEYNSTVWQSFYSRSNAEYVPDYIKMCIETIKKHSSKHFNIHVLSPSNIHQYVPKTLLKDLKGKNPKFMYDMFVVHILNKYGGVWMPASTILLKDIRPLYSHILTNGLLFGGFSCDSDEYFCLNSDNPDRSIFMAPANSPIIQEWHNSLLSLNNYQNDYSFNKRGENALKTVLQKFPSKIHLFDASMNGTRDCKLKLIGPDSLLSSNIGSVPNPKNLYLFNFDRNLIKNNFRHNWFEKASYKDIVKSTLWFTLLYRASMGLEINIDENVVGKSQTRNS